MHFSEKHKLSSPNSPPTALKYPVTPPESQLDKMTPVDLTSYEARFKECVMASKKRSEWKFIPSSCIERVQMPASYFHKLDEALGCGKPDLRYLF